MIGLVVFFYLYLDDNSSKDSEIDKKLVEILNYETEEEYPSTPKEVITLFNKMVEYLYGGKINKQDVESVTIQQRNLIKEAVLNENPLDVQVERIIYEIESYKKEKKKIIGSDIKEITPDNYFGENNEYCTVEVVYYLVKGNNPNINVYQEYILEKNEEGLWKILGWQQIEEFKIVGD